MRVPQFYVRSNVHMTNLDSAINRLLVNESLIDVTLSCDGHRFQCHRLVLAAASPLFEGLLMEHPKEHPIVIIPMGVKWHILKSLIDFMYRGQIYIDQAELKTLIESAELLQVIGLYDPQTQFREICNEDDGEVSSHNNTTFSNNDGKDEEEEKHIQTMSDLIENHREQEDSGDQYQDGSQENSDISNDKENIADEENYVNRPIERIVDFIEIDDSQDESALSPNEDEDCTPTNDQMAYEDQHGEASENSCLPISDENHSETNAGDPEIEEKKLLGSDILESVPTLTVTEKIVTSPISIETIPTIRVKPTIKLINLFKLNRPGQPNGNHSPSNVPWTYIHIPAQSGSNVQSPSTQVPLSANIATLPWPKDSLPQLTPVATTVLTKPVQKNNESILEYGRVVPSFLKFDSNSMAISIKNLDRTKDREKLNVLNMALEAELQENQPSIHANSENEDEDEVKQDDSEDNQLKEILDEDKNHGIKQEIQVKMEPMEFDNNQDNKTETENIICQPNVSYMYDGHEYGKDVSENVDDDEDGVCIDYDRLVAETYGNVQKNPQKLKNKANTKFKKSTKVKRSSAATENSTNIPPTHQFTALESTNTHHHLHQRFKDPPTLVPLSVVNAGHGPKHLYYHQNKNNPNMDIEEKINKGFSKNLSLFGKTTASTDSPDPRTQNSVILRNPRCNQPRHYSNESLYAALMAVKYGDSIYRASRLHQVPRKTLRNWMKRWDIKSQYPMPKQLKDAAKKKKLNQAQNA
ncbi:uncharacterized protein LOC129953296 [Eupeodes corollae]|uniref:uncharacterized protein LOC129953296 n=1 Tax=Eupeodes corollae TaxID=290404 RepID=UPI00248FE55F|nr:uncharacterized protein LOC129953296 [Eupeodes corollae]XP_055922319.1 uncharacterized protein LOC129953296 [Eupeodes corollae]XP_055922320.1 uncharacterized protein LOC129953296 [Eupeodes corollae]XP_055922321.1 uncharacterized protein LOC129953296 [Eupeodes corollae]XP_055922322.1 uncharacterized protein LOC129953296 [Eupeodes corollae]XP_055922323.1 uncharacterized protein LOC129953296 [Eupeodes corollae]XP_055922324.1 uncharacterized protein LOC129953296 [Eupeodes corollae]XP_05592232